MFIVLSNDFVCVQASKTVNGMTDLVRLGRQRSSKHCEWEFDEIETRTETFSERLKIMMVIKAEMVLLRRYVVYLLNPLVCTSVAAKWVGLG